METDKKRKADHAPMFNAYPDSIGGTLSDMAAFLEEAGGNEVFSSFYILPSLFHSDLDRGFSVIDYELNRLYATPGDLERIKSLGMDLKLDFVLNHASVLSKQFQDILKRGDASEYRDFFIDWNKFWEGKGQMTAEGYIQPEDKYLKDMFFRKPGLPILMVRLPEGKKVPYWNTFYQEVRYPMPDAQDIMRITDLQYGMAENLAKLICGQLAGGVLVQQLKFSPYEECREAVTGFLEANAKYLGQMDLNIRSPKVWEYYEDTLRKLAGYGAKIIRLDAFAYAPKTPGERNFLNEPGTWELLEQLKKLADRYELTLLPEIHADYSEKIYEKLAQKGYMTYDFFLPGLVIDALESGSGAYLAAWASELKEKNIRVVNMLGCHDGIPLLDLRGLLPEERIENLIQIVVDRGGMVKNLHGQKNVYYQVNAAYYSALGEDDRKFLLARAIQLFMPGKPQVWYLDLLAGSNDYEAVKRAGAGGHKEINRTNLGLLEARAVLKKEIVKKQLMLLEFRSQFPAFGFDAELSAAAEGTKLCLGWKKEDCEAVLTADLSDYSFEIWTKTGEKSTLLWRE